MIVRVNEVILVLISLAVSAWSTESRNLKDHYGKQ